MIIVYFKTHKFFRCSYLIRHMYQEDSLAMNPPEQIIWNKLFREIKTEKPIITLYDVVWDDYLTSKSIGNIDKDRFKEIDLMQTQDDQENEQEERTIALKKLGVNQLKTA